jgi:hypothetical protein
LLALNFVNDTLVFKNVAGTFESKDLETYKGLKDTVVFKKYDLRIFIDTTYRFTSKGIVFKNALFSVDSVGLRDSLRNSFYKNKIEFMNSRMLQMKNVSAYPVLFFNNSGKKIPFCDTSLEVRMIQEAKDSDGKWKPIEFYNAIGQCYSDLNLLLAPKHYSAAAIIKYKGNFKTKLRVKYYDGKNAFYSNEITGSINRSQFDQKYLKNFVIDTRGDNPNRDYNGFVKWMLLNN